jgi:hypothetical protein
MGCISLFLWYKGDGQWVQYMEDEMDTCKMIGFVLGFLWVVVLVSLTTFVCGCSSSLEVAVMHSGVPMVTVDDDVDAGDTLDAGVDEQGGELSNVCGTCGRNEVACTPDISLAMPVGPGEGICNPWLWVYGDIPDGAKDCLSYAMDCSDVIGCLEVEE